MGHLVFTNNIFTVIQEKCKNMIINICEKIQLIYRIFYGIKVERLY